MEQAPESNPSITHVQFLRRPAVEKLTGLPRSSIYKLMEAGEFPKPVKLSAQAVAWLESEVLDWMNQRIEAARTTKFITQ